MNQGKYVFAQVMSFIPNRVLDRCVKQHEGNKYIKHFSCWNQLSCMMFGQLSGRDSLRDLVLCVSPHQSKFYHLGFGKNITRSNLSLANEKRDYRIYEELAYHLVSVAQGNAFHEDEFLEGIDGPVYAFDSSLIDLCLSVFWWAKFRREKGGVKLHVLLDVKTNIPVFAHITTGKEHDVNTLDKLDYEPGGFYILDKGYIDFARLFIIALAGAYFVTRAKKNFQCNIIRRSKVNRKKGVRSDHRISLKGFYPSQNYPEHLRKIRFYDEENKRCFVFLTNNFELKAAEIAMLYKYRWKIELFFKWIKQHLQVKSFWGTTLNAVKTQVYISIITYLTVSIIRNKMKTKHSNYEVLQIIGVSLLDKTPLRDLLEKPVIQDFKEQNDKQLKINLS